MGQWEELGRSPLMLPPHPKFHGWMLVLEQWLGPTVVLSVSWEQIGMKK